MQTKEEKRYITLRDEITKVKSAIENAKTTREKVFESDFNEFCILERRLKNLLEQTAKV